MYSCTGMDGIGPFLFCFVLALEWMGLVPSKKNSCSGTWILNCPSILFSLRWKLEWMGLFLLFFILALECTLVRVHFFLLLQWGVLARLFSVLALIGMYWPAFFYSCIEMYWPAFFYGSELYFEVHIALGQWIPRYTWSFDGMIFMPYQVPGIFFLRFEFSTR